MRSVFLLLILLLPHGEAAAQSSDDPFRFVRWPANDVRHFAASRSAADLLAVGGAAAILLGASHFDRSLTENIAEATRRTPKKFIEEFGNAKAVRPMTGMLFIGSLMTGSRRFQDASFTALEAVVLANLFTNTLKSVVGRARPYQDEGPSSIEPFSGNTSFPSGHTTTVFALVTPFALYFPGMASKGLFVLAAATASSRMATEFHWFTDVLAGAAIGTLTARTLTRLHQGRSTSIRIRPRFGPNQVALELRF